MQQWPATRPRCHSDPIDSTTSPLLSFGDLDGFEKNANETLWNDYDGTTLTGNNNKSGSCMFTALSQAMASISYPPHPRLCSSDDLSPVSPVSPSSSSSSLQTFVSSIRTSAVLNSSPPDIKYAETINGGGGGGLVPLVPTSLADVLCSSDHEQSESYDAACRSSPDSIYASSPGALTPADTTVFENEGSPSRDSASRPKRRPYSKLQLMHLEQEFQQSMYPCRERRAWLSQLLSLSERQVKIWFQNRRTKLKRSVERERKEHEQMQRDMATLAMQFYAPPPPASAKH